MLLVPFHTPQGPSTAQWEDSTANTEEDDLRSRIWGDWWGLDGGGWGVWTRGTPSGSGEPYRRRVRERRVGVGV